jgi:hypothetical protein
MEHSQVQNLCSFVVIILKIRAKLMESMLTLLPCTDTKHTTRLATKGMVAGVSTFTPTI